MDAIAVCVDDSRMLLRLSVASRGEPRSARSAKRVLIVDDVRSFRRAVRELLERRGYEVVAEADSAAAAIDAVERLELDAVLLDIDLRDANGFDVCAYLTRAHPELAVLLMSAVDENRLPFVGVSGARGFVPKSQLASVEFARFWP
jgi:DNA-binding NarL/FixJ family response regulator